MRPRPATNSDPRPRSTPSESQITSMSGEAASSRLIVGSASVRSTAWGFGFNCVSRTRAAAGGCTEMSRVASPRVTSATPRLSASARARMSSAVRSRKSQLAAALKPSSIRSARGVEPLDVASGGFHSGPAAARMTSVASRSRNSVSHHGVRDGVSSFGLMSNSSRVGGNSTRSGRGGMSRNSHHRTGRLSRPRRMSGCAKPSGRPIMRASRAACRRAAAGCSSPLRCLRRSGCAAPAATHWVRGRCGGW